MSRYQTSNSRRGGSRYSHSSNIGRHVSGQSAHGDYSDSNQGRRDATQTRARGFPLQRSARINLARPQYRGHWDHLRTSQTRPPGDHVGVFPSERSARFSSSQFEYKAGRPLIRALGLNGRQARALEAYNDSMENVLPRWSSRCCTPGCQPIVPGAIAPRVIQHVGIEDSLWREKLRSWVNEYHMNPVRAIEDGGPVARNPVARNPDRMTHLSDTHGLHGFPTPTFADETERIQSEWCRDQRSLYRQFYVVGRRGRGESLWIRIYDHYGDCRWEPIMRDDGSVNVPIEKSWLETHMSLEDDQDRDAICSIFAWRRLSSYSGVSRLEFDEARDLVRAFDNSIQDDQALQHEEWEQAPVDTQFFRQSRDPHPGLAAAVASLRIEEVSTLEGSDPLCAICYNEFKIGDVCYRLPCDHRFHLLCLSPLWREKPEGDCPICRKSIITGRDPEQRRDQPSRGDSLNGVHMRGGK